MNCRHCNSALNLCLVDLGTAPPSNAYLKENKLNAPELWYPLRVLVCSNCWLVQTEDFAEASLLFDAEYAYFSSFSTFWLAHSKKYVSSMVERFTLTDKSHVVEIAANDGYLLQYVKELGIPCTGIEPTASTAAAARLKGINVVEEFFGVALAEDLIKKNLSADLVVANNVLAHVPDINDFILGFAKLLKPKGVATFEFPHLLRLIESNQFDTIYHEHFSYLSLTAANRMFTSQGMTIFDVEELPTHGGSLRLYAQRADTGKYVISQNVIELLDRERKAGMMTSDYYSSFQSSTDNVKNEFLKFLINAKESGKSVVAYGAAAKGNTLMNYAGIKQDLISYVVDRNPEKQNKFMPGSRIPIVSEDKLKESRPDYVVILPWNLRNEVMTQIDYIKGWGGKFVVAVPALEVF